MQELFPPLIPSARRALSLLPEALSRVMPLSSAHRRQLPLAVEELSTRLTSERGLDSKPYWSAPRLTAAYLWYFLPWNILRLTRLLRTLPLPAPTPLPVEEAGPPLPRVMADMGSGPLSLPIALWLARPEWHDIPLTIVCTDLSPHPLELGQSLFKQVAGESPWRIITARAPLEGLDKEMRRLSHENRDTWGLPWLISAANVCNELKPRPQQSMEERLGDLLGRLFPLLEAADAHLLMVEPGTRLGGKTIASLREAALDLGLAPVAPCPHVGTCPLEDSRTWCHFTFDVQGCPAWLTELSASAGLRKESLSLSFALLHPSPLAEDREEGSAAAVSPETEGKGRIISAPFRVPGLGGMSRYACHQRGLVLTPRAEGLPSGALVSFLKPKGQECSDAKSGALILDHAETVAPVAQPMPDRAVRSPHASQSPRPLPQQAAPEKAPPRSDKPAPAEKKERKKKPVPKASKKNAKKFWEK